MEDDGWDPVLSQEITRGRRHHGKCQATPGPCPAASPASTSLQVIGGNRARGYWSPRLSKELTTAQTRPTVDNEVAQLRRGLSTAVMTKATRSPTTSRPHRARMWGGHAQRGCQSHKPICPASRQHAEKCGCEPLQRAAPFVQHEP